jgi:hypothetical protein
MIQPKLGLGFLKALLYGPPDAAQPDEGFQAGAARYIADIEGMGRGLCNSPLDDQPDRLAWQAVLAIRLPVFS